MDKKNPNEFQFKFVKTEDFKTTPVNGVWGGITVGGNLNMNFYIDTVEMPKQVVHSVVHGKISQHPKIPIPTSNVAIREVPFGVTLDITTARQVAEWINRHIDHFEKTQRKEENAS